MRVQAAKDRAIYKIMKLNSTLCLLFHPLYNVKRIVSFADLFDKQLNNPAASNFSCVPYGPVQVLYYVYFIPV